ncbi:aspartyl protease family protein [Hymenobacter lapidiphilus]|uniref:Aspartyl protease family protein n=1 Tax=Hymenobacter lapidiphilus TaxID=2608003 RepID=A0A7Y7U5E1_9BACT|nr:aspartyl protease family protein [Hymenobacter lapidiphilus]NVO30360.1 aspartyl protease family protein [Hymenobacter lapidiphilus]
MAQAKKIDTKFRPEDLALPPRLTAPIKLIDGLMVVEAEIDGRRGAFFLDTGASSFVLNKARFAMPGTMAAPNPTAPMGVNGSVGAMSYYQVGRFDWEGLGFQNKEVPTVDLTQVEKKLNGTPLLGIIGYNLLNQYALTLDYRAGRVELRRPGTEDAAATAAAVPLLTVPFTLRGHLPVLPFTLAGQTYDLALDTGAQSNLLDEQLAPALASRLRKSSQATLAGAGSATRQVVQGQLPEMQLAGKLAFRRQRTVFSDISHLNKTPGAASIQGIAGYPMLSQYRTTIDYVNKQLILTSW